MAKEMETKEVKKVMIKSELESIIMHNGIKIMPKEAIKVEKDVADHLIKLGYCKEVKTREV